MNDVDPNNQGTAAFQPPGRSGDRPSVKLDRFLRAAAQARADAPIEAPFGFDTRVVALWRAGLLNGNHGLARFVQRVAAIAVVAIIVSAAAVLYEVKQARESSELDANEFVIADSAIESEFPQ
jgi:hypothetical protein